MSFRRVLLLLIVALGVALYIPSSRAAILDFVSPVMEPMYRWETEEEMRRIVGDLVAEDRTGGRLPQRGPQFRNWLSRQYANETAALDGWGVPYELRSWADSFVVLSAGPDRRIETDDDLRELGNRPRSRSRRR